MRVAAEQNDLRHRPSQPGAKPSRRSRRFPRRGVRPGPARFELFVTAIFASSMMAAVALGGPTNLERASLLAAPFLLLGLLVVRRELFVVVAVPVLMSLFFDNQTSHELRLENPQVVYWVVGGLLWAPVLLAGYWIRKRFDRNRCPE